MRQSRFSEEQIIGETSDATVASSNTGAPLSRLAMTAAREDSISSSSRGVGVAPGLAAPFPPAARDSSPPTGAVPHLYNGSIRCCHLSVSDILKIRIT